MMHWGMNGKNQNMDMKETKNKEKTEKTQVLSCRISKSNYEKFEKTCLENRIPMSKIMRDAVNKYLDKKLTLTN